MFNSFFMVKCSLSKILFKNYICKDLTTGWMDGGKFPRRPYWGFNRKRYKRKKYEGKTKDNSL